MATISTRYIFEVPLKPVLGDIFQPTGFPDIGTATFVRPGQPDQQHILVESPQSMANRLEAIGWNSYENKPIDALASLPWVKVVDSQDENNYITSSRTEAHRLSSAFIRNSQHPDDDSKTMVEYFAELFELEDDKPLSNHTISAQIFKLDPLCLIHGVFFADNKLPGQPKISRAISACIEAHNVQPAYSGGVKRDQVRHSIKEGQGGSSEGYGSIPFHRTEYLAESIIAKFIIDRTQIKSYRLSDEATELLETLALWEVRKLLSEPMRLRTACDLETIEELVDQEGNKPLFVEELESRITDLCGSVPELAGAHIPLTVKWNPKGK